MSADRKYSARKSDYFAKIVRLVDEHPNILVVGADNVGSNQMQQIRRALRGKAILLMGKNVRARSLALSLALSAPSRLPLICVCLGPCVLVAYRL